MLLLLEAERVEREQQRKEDERRKKNELLLTCSSSVPLFFERSMEYVLNDVLKKMDLKFKKKMRMMKPSKM